MCLPNIVPVGASKAPMAMAILPRWTGSQNRAEPQVAQKPRRTFSDDWNQRTWSSPWIVTSALATSVEAQKCPEVLRHWLQWQASGAGSAPATSKLTAPQRQDPLCMAILLLDPAPGTAPIGQAVSAQQGDS